MHTALRQELLLEREREIAERLRYAHHHADLRAARVTTRERSLLSRLSLGWTARRRLSPRASNC